MTKGGIYTTIFFRNITEGDLLRDKRRALPGRRGHAGIAISQSGETADTLAAIELAKEKGAAAYRPDEVAELLQTSGAENAVLVYSGDTGFYSGASSMMEKLEALGYDR